MDIQRAHDVVYQAWVDRASLVLETAGWHRCTKKCNMQRLRAYACLEGNHAISTPTCPDHPESRPVLVGNLYVCVDTGRRHVCSSNTCTIDQGVCVLTGAPVVQHAPNVQHTNRQLHRRRDRRRGSVYTQDQLARAFVYDMLFSNKRREYERSRHAAALDMSRRVVQRHVRQAVRDSAPLYVQDILDILHTFKDRLRSTEHFACADKQRRDTCVQIATNVTNLWRMISSHVQTTYTFETTVAAILYIMRRGMAYDGVWVVPANRFLWQALPDAHAIREFGIHRRQFTQLKNHISTAISNIVDTRLHTAVEIADCYSNSS